MKCRVDEGPEGLSYNNLKRGRPIQTHWAKELHAKAGAPEGPCGIAELQQFQSALPGYQMKLMSVDGPYCIILSRPPADKFILLIKVKKNYHGCSSFGGFLSRSYYCLDWDKAFDHDDKDNHPCKGKWCPSCEKKCSDFDSLKSSQPPGTFPKLSMSCHLCHCLFFAHVRKTSQHTNRLWA